MFISDKDFDLPVNKLKELVEKEEYELTMAITQLKKYRAEEALRIGLVERLKRLQNIEHQAIKDVFDVDEIDDADKEVTKGIVLGRMAEIVVDSRAENKSCSCDLCEMASEVELNKQNIKACKPKRLKKMKKPESELVYEIIREEPKSMVEITEKEPSWI